MCSFLLLVALFSTLTKAFWLHFSDGAHWHLPEEAWTLFNQKPAQGVCSYWEEQEEKNFYLHVKRENLESFLSLLQTFQKHSVEFGTEEWQAFLGASQPLWKEEIVGRVSQAQAAFNALFWEEIELENNFNLQIEKPDSALLESLVKFYLLEVREKVVPAVFRCDFMEDGDIGVGGYGRVSKVFDFNVPYFDITQKKVMETCTEPGKYIFKEVAAFTQKKSSTKELEIGLALSDIPQMAGMIAAVIDVKRPEEILESTESNQDGTGDLSKSPHNESEKSSRSNQREQVHFTDNEQIPEPMLNIVQNPARSDILLGFMGEYAALGTLDVFLDEDENYEFFTRESLLQKLRTLWTGITAMHAKKYVHRDIKMNNILVYHGAQPGDFSFKLSDFGISDKMGNLREFRTQNRAKYCPLESYEPSLKSYLNSPAVDIYQFGLLLQQICSVLWQVKRITWGFTAFGPLLKYTSIYNPTRKRIDYSFISAYFDKICSAEYGKSFIYIQAVVLMPDNVKGIKVEDSFRGHIAVNKSPLVCSFLALANLSIPYRGMYWFEFNDQSRSPFYSLSVGAVSTPLVLFFPRGLPFLLQGSILLEEIVEFRNGDWLYIDSNYPNHSIYLIFPNHMNPEAQVTERYGGLNSWGVFDILRSRILQLKELNPQNDFPIVVASQ